MSLLITHQQFAEAIEPGVGDFDDPAPRWVSSLCPMLFDARAHMGNVATAANRFLGGCTAKPSVGAQVLSPVPSDAWSANDNRVEHGLELRDIMMIGRGDDDRQRDATGVDQQHPLAPLFFPDPSGLARRILGPAAL